MNMKTIKILGTGCPNCKKTEAIVKAAVKQLNIDVEIEKVEDIQDIMAYNIMSTPAIVIDEKVIFKGHVPSSSEITKLLKEVCCNEADSSCCEPLETVDEPCCGGHPNTKSTGCC
jgi:small redox-active disulfide protein 2